MNWKGGARLAEEKNFETKVKNFLKLEGAWFVKYWGGAAFTKSGIPDLLVCLNGLFMGVELKATHGKPSELQLHTLKQIDEAGGIALLLYPKDFRMFKDLVYTINDLGFTDAEPIYEELKGRWY